MVGNLVGVAVGPVDGPFVRLVGCPVGDHVSVGEVGLKVGEVVVLVGLSDVVGDCVINVGDLLGDLVRFLTVGDLVGALVVVVGLEDGAFVSDGEVGPGVGP